MKAPDILKTAAAHMEDRAATYDKPEGERSMAATVNAFRCIAGHDLTEEQGWLFMQILKAVRSQQGEYRADSYEDGAAYASLAGEAAYRERVFSQATANSMPFQATHLDFDESRIDRIASSHGDGEHYAEDMSDPANWRAGDLVECVKYNMPSELTIGKIYPLIQSGSRLAFIDDAGDVQLSAISKGAFRFHSRPSQVNEQEMSGIWHHHDGGECPCDEKSMVEVELRGCAKLTGSAQGFHWRNNGDMGDIIRYRML